MTPPATERSACEICREIPKCSSVTESVYDGRRDGALPPATERLVVFLEIPESNVQRVCRCPLCGHFYLYRYEYEYLATGSEDTFSYEWTTADDVLALYAVKKSKRAELRFDGAAWTLVDLDAEARRASWTKDKPRKTP